jgi:hypothetical protein
MKSGVLKCTKRLDFIFKIEYRNAVLSRGTLIHKRRHGSCAQEIMKLIMKLDDLDETLESQEEFEKVKGLGKNEDGASQTISYVKNNKKAALGAK